MHSVKKIIHNGPILMKLYQPVFVVRFFKTKCSCLCTVTVHMYCMYLSGQLSEHFVPFVLLYCITLLSTVVNNHLKQKMMMIMMTLASDVRRFLIVQTAS